jgi:hypothetical protein
MCCIELSKNIKCIFVWIGALVVILSSIVGFILLLRNNETVKNMIYTSKKGVDNGHSPSEINTFIINTLYWLSTTGIETNITKIL